MFIRTLRADFKTQITSMLLIVFALLFLVIGIWRSVEFYGLGLSKFRKNILISIHIMGCIAASALLALVAIDLHRNHTNTTTILFITAVIFLFPVQIYLGILRRIKIKNSTRL